MSRHSFAACQTSPHIVAFLLIILSQICGLYFFSSGFLNYRRSASSSSSHRSPSLILDLPSDVSLGAPEPSYTHLVFVLIDALRADFVYAADSPMENLRRWRASGQAKAFIARARAPTVTLPRLKAITAGSQPAFLDFLANLDEGASVFNAVDASNASNITTKHTGDTWINGLTRMGKKLVFYGDDTWLRLFPDAFARYEGVQSFFVADYTHVDLNVTRHLPSELERADWDAMILHYLGVDHIGHLEGPRSKLMAPKLLEMDGVLERIYTRMKILDQADHNRKTLIVVAGDHGMTEAGNHGGSSPAETEAATLFITPSETATVGKADEPFLMEQVDIASTLALLFGLPIPNGSTGRLATPMFSNMTLDNQLYLQLLNAAQLQAALEAAAAPKTALLELAFQCHRDFLLTRDASSKDLHGPRCMALYNQFLDEASALLSKGYGEYQLGRMFWGIVCLLLALLIPIYLLFRHHATILSSNHRIGIWLASSFGGIYCLSIMSTSFIDEEHEIWYWWTPFVAFLLVVLSTRRHGAIRTEDAVAWFGLAGCLRILRFWNATGYENRAAYDARAWLNEHAMLANLLMVVTLSFYAGLAWQSFRHTRFCSLKRLMILILVFSIAAYKGLMAASGSVLLARAIFALLTLSLILASATASKTSKDHDRPTRRKGRARATPLTIHLALLLIFLSRIHNVFPFLLFYVMLCSLRHFATVDLSPDSWLLRLELAMSLIKVSYFSMGACNLVASIDLSTAYTGLTSFSILPVGLITFAIAFAGPLLFAATSSIVHSWPRSSAVPRSTADIPSSSPAAINLMTLLLRRAAASLSIAIAATIQRHHISVWTVFAPRLLFELLWTSFDLFFLIFPALWKLV